MYLLFLVVGIGNSIGSVNAHGIIVPYAKYALVGIFGLLITSQMTQTIYRTTIDKRWGLLPLKFLNGVKPFYYIIGMSTYPIIGFLFQTILLYILSIFLGYNFTPLNYFLGLLLAVISLLFWTSLGALLTVFINDYQRRDSIIGLLILPLGFTAPTFFVLDSVPRYINIIAHINPITYQITAIRSVIFGNINLFFIALTILLTTLSILVCSIVLYKAKLVVTEK